MLTIYSYWRLSFIWWLWNIYICIYYILLLQNCRKCIMMNSFTSPIPTYIPNVLPTSPLQTRYYYSTYIYIYLRSVYIGIRLWLYTYIPSMSTCIHCTKGTHIISFICTKAEVVILYTKHNILCIIYDHFHIVPIYTICKHTCSG